MSSRCGEGAFPKPLPQARRVPGLGGRGERLRACSPTLASFLHGPKAWIRVGTGPLGVPGCCGTPSPGPECSACQGIYGLLKGYPLQDRDGAARKLFQPTKRPERSLNQTRVFRLEGAQKPFVLWFPVVGPNFCRLEPCSRCS